MSQPTLVGAPARFARRHGLFGIRGRAERLPASWLGHTTAVTVRTWACGAIIVARRLLPAQPSPTTAQPSHAATTAQHSSAATDASWATSSPPPPSAPPAIEGDLRLCQPTDSSESGNWVATPRHSSGGRLVEQRGPCRDLPRRHLGHRLRRQLRRFWRRGGAPPAGAVRAVRSISRRTLAAVLAQSGLDDVACSGRGFAGQLLAQRLGAPTTVVTVRTWASVAPLGSQARRQSVWWAARRATRAVSRSTTTAPGAPSATTASPIPTRRWWPPAGAVRRYAVPVGVLWERFWPDLARQRRLRRGRGFAGQLLAQRLGRPQLWSW